MLRLTQSQFRLVSARANAVLYLLIPLAFTAVILEHGFHLSASLARLIESVQLIVIAVFVLQQVIKLMLVPRRDEYITEHRFDLVLLVSLVLFSILFILIPSTILPIARFFGFPSSLDFVLDMADVYIILHLLSSFARYTRRLSRLKIQPAQLFISTFVFVILSGAAGLLLPRATTHGISVVDALFTSTSAVCVTGLVVVDTGTTFTLLGQTIILLLIQIGGLGLMTFTTFFALFHGSLGIKEKVLMQEFLSGDNVGKVKSALQQIVGVTLLIEAMGALFLFLSWQPGTFDSLSHSAYNSVFHAVSAFCNAGFSTLSANIADPRTMTNVPINLTICALIVLGGLGFSVIVNVAGLLRRPRGGHRVRLSLHSKLVLIMTALLIVVGTLFVYVLEYFNTLEGMAEGNKWVASLFQSITTRTAGFNSIDIGAIAPATAFVMVVWMFIGASPGSTGGGIKTTTAAVLALSAWNVVRGRQKVEVFRRQVTQSTLDKAVATIMLSGLLVMIATFILSIYESAPFLDLLFEATSAFGTVGLSRNLTPALTDVSKLTLVVTMLVGRVGAVTLVMALTAKAAYANYDYPSDSVMIG